MIAIEQGVQLNDVHRFHMRTLSRSIGRVQPEVCREAIHGLTPGAIKKLKDNFAKSVGSLLAGLIASRPAWVYEGEASSGFLACVCFYSNWDELGVKGIKNGNGDSQVQEHWNCFVHKGNGWMGWW